MGAFNASRYLGAYQCPDDEPYSCNDEWYAQPLAHVEDHVGLEGFLVVLYKLDEEAAEEDADEEYAQYQPHRRFHGS